MGLSDFSLAPLEPPAMARNSLRPTRAMFLQEKGSSPCLTIRKKYIYFKVQFSHVEINSIDSVGLTGPGLPGDEVDEGGGELESELNHSGDKASLLLGLGAQFGRQLAVDAIADVIWGASELATELFSRVSMLWQTVTLDKAGTED